MKNKTVSFFIFLIIVFACLPMGEIHSEERDVYLIKTLDRIDKKTTSIESIIMMIIERLSKVETWQEEKIRDIERFYANEFNELKTNNQKQDFEINMLRNEFEKSKSFFVGLVFCGGVLSSCLTILMQVWVLKKRKEEYSE
tara:strand:+ start:1179 stop:1601 length:423 start_codon:yes stop_codon:yes gene_type:complete